MKYLLCALIFLTLPLMAQEQKVVSLPEDAAKKLQCMNKEFFLFTPKNYESAESVPLIIFLHGSGERGTDINKVAVHGIPKIAPKNENFEFMGVSPQCLRKEKMRWTVEDLDILLDYVTKTYKVDKKRIYLTGLSMGGYGTWAWAAKRPNVFAAAAPICGGGNPADAKNYGKMPIWVFHGDKDRAVKIEKSQVMVDAIKKAGGNVKFTIYPGVGHDSWTATYNNPELYKWFLSHKKE
ncbi:MAG: prolyl oligopeptidase family serine peptidase [Lentisphaeraceae bacterium]|nr:prolyl oligopeptidase family serine peptidase [Lentisphaeraceae bacterium]